MIRRAALFLVLLAVLAGCVGSSADDSDYVSKAAKTIDVVRSSVETVGLAAQVIDEGGGYDPYLNRLIGQAEDDATSAVDGFDSVQPPSPESDDLRENLDDLTTDAIDLLSQARIAIRRSDAEGVAALAEQLQASAEALAQFKDEQL